ncbi:MAG: hypothetical protein JWR71_3439 [Pseudarthrobacter sp.]|nr:hypothetical protein [Pseudarthrobacter sp.]
MCGTEHRTDAASERLQLQLVGAAAAGCSCCSPAARSGASPVAADASVHLGAGGRSRLVVAGTVDASAVQKAVSSAGYTFVPAGPGLEEES